MKTFFYIITTLLFIISGTVYLSAAERNLIMGGGFEESHLPDEWQRNIWKNGGAIDITTDKVHTGKQALKVYTGKQLNDVRIVRNITIKPNTFYTYSGWIATVDVGNDGTGGNIGFIGGLECAGNLKGTQDWQYFQISFRTSSMQKSVSLAAGIGTFGKMAQGTVYIDDLVLIEQKEAPASFITFKSPSDGKGITGQNHKKAPALTKKVTTITGLILLALLIIFINLAIISYRHGGLTKKIIKKIIEKIKPTRLNKNAVIETEEKDC